MHSEVIKNPLIRDNLGVLCKAIKDLDLGLERKARIEFFCDLNNGEILYTPSMIPPHEMALLIINVDLDKKAVTWKTKEGAQLLPKAESHLHEMAQILTKHFSMIEKLGQLTHIHWQGLLENQENNTLLKQTWHDVDRENAERLLAKQTVGTFIFRKDRFAISLQEILRRGLKKAIHCYTISYVDNQKIVRDKTIVFVDKKWTFYDDDPSLAGSKWNSIEELVQSIDSLAKHPLYAHMVLPHSS